MTRSLRTPARVGVVTVLMALLSLVLAGNPAVHRSLAGEVAASVGTIGEERPDQPVGVPDPLVGIDGPTLRTVELGLLLGGGAGRPSKRYFAVADAVPRFNIEPSCKGGLDSPGLNERYSRCISEENGARQKLEQTWSTWPAADPGPGWPPRSNAWPGWSAAAAPLPDNAVRLYTSNKHMENFFDCVRSRQAPIAS